MNTLQSHRPIQRWIELTLSLSALACAGLFGAQALAQAPTEPLKVGVAVLEITPPAGYRMSGYFRERLATGTHDPLLAKALVLQQEVHGTTQQATLVFCDLIGMAPQVAADARRKVEALTGIPYKHVAIAATHTHTGPLYFGALREWFHHRALQKIGRDSAESVDYPKQLTATIVAAVQKAQKQLTPVWAFAGVGQETRLSFNRRFHMKDGSVRFNPGQKNPNIVRPAGPIDPEIGLVRFQSLKQGTDLGLLSVFALHLDTVGGTQYAADFPLYLQQELRKACGQEILSLFGAGTCGDINHIDVTTQGRRSAKQIGTLLAESVLRTLPQLKPIKKPSLAVKQTVVSVPLQQFSRERLVWARQSMPKIGTRDLGFLEQVEAYKIMAVQMRTGQHPFGGQAEGQQSAEELKTTLGLEVQAFRLGPEVALVTLPGEVFAELGLAIKQRSPFATTLVIELTNDAPGYIPTRKAFAQGSYETVNSRVQTGSGEQMVEAAVRLLSELKNGLSANDTNKTNE